MLGTTWHVDYYHGGFLRVCDQHKARSWMSVSKFSYTSGNFSPSQLVAAATAASVSCSVATLLLLSRASSLSSLALGFCGKSQELHKSVRIAGSFRRAKATPRHQGASPFSFSCISSTYLADIQSLPQRIRFAASLSFQIDDHGRLPAWPEREMPGGGHCHDAIYGSITSIHDRC